jgi:hypothetical protein
MEFVGLARQLRRRLAKAQALYEPAADRLLKPFRPRPGFQPMPRRTHLARLAKQWRALPRFGRLRCLVNVTDGKLQIAETRLAPSRLTLPWWDQDDEPALSLVLRTVAIVPPQFREHEMVLVEVGLHALARRFERGVPDDAEIGDDFNSLGRAYPDVVRQGGEFRIPVADGSWRGVLARAADKQPAMVVRTFVAD